MINKKKWIKPQLIVLDKGTPEEMVLSGCKYHGGLKPKGGPGSNNCKGPGGGSCLALNPS